MSRAMAWIEAAGVPAVGIACRGFVSTTGMVAKYEGLSSPRLVEYPPPNVAVQNPEQVRQYAESLADSVIAALTSRTQAPAAGSRERPDPPGIEFSGDLDEVNEFFRSRTWTDGLPIVPPTRERVEAMLRFAGRNPDEPTGILPPRRHAATARNIAVNAVMAGCRPEYMPVLLALVEAIAEPRFGLEHAGSTVGWSPLIILNGPIAKELGFHSGQGVLRPQHQANASVSRFLRLAMMNIAGFRVGETDLATFGRNYYPVVAEAEDASPWPPMCADLGFEPGSNVVTVQSADTVSHSFLSEGDAEEHLRIIALELARELGGSMLVPMERFGGEVSPVVGLTPLVSGIIAQGGFSRQDVKRHLFEHALIPAGQFDERLRRHELGLDLNEAVRRGTLDERWSGDDPDRHVPVVHKPEEIQIVVCGSPNRNRSFIAAQFGNQGLRVSKAIKLPPDWTTRRTA